jgi:hypothetical protein
MTRRRKRTKQDNAQKPYNANLQASVETFRGPIAWMIGEERATETEIVGRKTVPVYLQTAHGVHLRRSRATPIPPSDIPMHIQPNHGLRMSVFADAFLPVSAFESWHRLILISSVQGQEWELHALAIARRRCDEECS